jgi:hypothetical protein
VQILHALDPAVWTFHGIFPPAPEPVHLIAARDPAIANIHKSAGIEQTLELHFVGRLTAVRLPNQDRAVPL